MSALTLPVSGDPGEVWRVGYVPNPWEWTRWEFAFDAGRFNGRWDDQNAEFRTLYSCESLLGCFLELLASLRPLDVAFDELDAIDDDADAVARYPDPERGAVGMEWLSGRLYGRGEQTGTYAEVTHSMAISYLVDAGVFDRLGIPAQAVDASLLKDAAKRDVTRSVARYLYDLIVVPARRGTVETSHPLVDGIAFRSRMGDELRMWAVFERGTDPVSEKISPDGDFQPIIEDNVDLMQAFTMLGLHWNNDI